MRMPRVNHEILKWARESSGLDEREAAKKIGLKTARGKEPRERLAAIESGAEEPSRRQLLNMAKAYRRSLLVFYLEDVPPEGKQTRDFRTIDGAPPVLRGRIQALLREIRVGHALLVAALEEAGETDRLAFIDSIKREEGVAKAARSITQTLEFDRKEFRKGTYDRGFKYLREQAGEAGIYALLKGDLGSYHSKIGVDTFRGFALAHGFAPLVVINVHDAKPARSFTLLHEIAHLWIGESGVSDYSSGKPVELFCNEVAARILVDPDELHELDDISSLSIEEATTRLQAFSRKRNVSGLMVATALVRAGLLASLKWSDIKNELDERWERLEQTLSIKQKENDGFPNPKVIARFNAGPRLLGTVRRLLGFDYLTPSQAARVLGSSPNTIVAMVESAQ